ncbi:MAG: uracil-DNA glycosylase family protein [Polaromonas sp.]
MSLDLDKRQRAMLREMGVQVWLPETPAAEPRAALKIAAAGAENPPETKALSPVVPVATGGPTAPLAPTPPPATAPPRQPLPAQARGEDKEPSWSLGEAQPLYTETTLAEGARWLVLAEMPAPTLAASRSSLPSGEAGLAGGGPARRPQAAVFDGDAGRLLDNMLRAARLHVAGAVLLAPVVRHAAAPPGEEFSAALAALISQAQPDVVLLMGRLASQALLQSTEPLGRLRGRVHALHGARGVVTYDATYLLRTAADKARAWDDLRLAMRLAAAS